MFCPTLEAARRRERYALALGESHRVRHPHRKLAIDAIAALPIVSKLAEITNTVLLP